jgi:hypothetical protein
MSYPYFQNNGAQEISMYSANQSFGLGYSMSDYYSGNGRYFNPDGSYNFGAMRNKAWTYINNYNTGGRINMDAGNAYTTIFNVQNSIGRGAYIRSMNQGCRVWIRNYNTAVGPGGTGGNGYPNSFQGGTNGGAIIASDDGGRGCYQMIINTQGYTWIGGGGGGGGGNGGRRRTGSLPISPNNSSGGGGGGGGGGWGTGGGRPNAYYQGGSGQNGNQVYGGAGGGNGGNAQDGFYGGNWGAAGTYGWAAGGQYEGFSYVQGYQIY